MRFQHEGDHGEKALSTVVNFLNLIEGECRVMFSRLCPEELRFSEFTAQAGAAFYETLHRVFDQWLASGRDRSGVETPLDRTVSKIPTGFLRPLSDELNDWLTRRALPQTVDEYGQRVEREPFVDFQGLKSAPRLVGQDFAVFWFLYLMGSPHRYRLARCANPACEAATGRWFVYDRKPRRTIKRGTFCKDCKTHGAALRRDWSRDAKASLMQDAAAAAWGKWKHSKRNPLQREWVAEQVNKQFKTNITRRWVSQNLEPILARVEGLQNAEG